MLTCPPCVPDCACTGTTQATPLGQSVALSGPSAVIAVGRRGTRANQCEAPQREQPPQAGIRHRALSRGGPAGLAPTTHLVVFNGAHELGHSRHKDGQEPTHNRLIPCASLVQQLPSPRLTHLTQDRNLIIAEVLVARTSDEGWVLRPGRFVHCVCVGFRRRVFFARGLRRGPTCASWLLPVTHHCHWMAQQPRHLENMRMIARCRPLMTCVLTVAARMRRKGAARRQRLVQHQQRRFRTRWVARCRGRVRIVG